MAPEAGQTKDPRAWDALTPPLAEWILDAIAAMGFVKMTPVQASCIPLFMGNKDVVVEVSTRTLPAGHHLHIAGSNWQWENTFIPDPRCREATTVTRATQKTSRRCHYSVAHSRISHSNTLCAHISVSLSCAVGGNLRTSRRGYKEKVNFDSLCAATTAPWWHNNSGTRS